MVQGIAVNIMKVYVLIVATYAVRFMKCYSS
jgi:hypothetical protein